MCPFSKFAEKQGSLHFGSSEEYNTALKVSGISKDNNETFKSLIQGKSAI